NIDYFIFTIYGLLSAYLLTLLHGDIFAGYQPAYQAYLFAVTSVITLGCFTAFITSTNQNTRFNILQRYFQFFSYSLCAVMSALLIFSQSIPLLVVGETNKIINLSHDRDSAYCIQMLTSSGIKKYQDVTTLLDLSPLTMWSKASLGSSFGWGKSYFHALLVVKKQNSTDLYNWSYRLRTWSYLKPGFVTRASIDRPEIVCIPQQNYLQKIPWVFPKVAFWKQRNS
ncbi:MAG: hypothetical protein ACRC2R_04110, partial [Xenococcaceae cyanobacterium]